MQITSTTSNNGLIATIREQWRYRELLVALTWREIFDRYQGQPLGIVWAIAHPLIMTAVYITVFAYVFQVKTGVETGSSFLVYMLSGLIPWMTVQETLVRTSIVILSNSNLVKQVAFPLQLLPIKTVLACIVNQLLCSTLFLVYLIASKQAFSWMMLLWPALILIQTVGLIGVGYLLSSCGVFVRDLKDAIIAFCTVAIYCLPIFYNLNQVPSFGRYILLANPISHLIFCYQDILYYGKFEHAYSWIFVILGIPTIFLSGVLVFSRLRPTFGDAL